MRDSGLTMTASSTFKFNCGRPNGWDKPTAAIWRRGCWKSKALYEKNVNHHFRNLKSFITYCPKLGSPPKPKWTYTLNFPRGSSLQPKRQKLGLGESKKSHPLHRANSPTASIQFSLVVDSKIWSSESPTKDGGLGFVDLMEDGQVWMERWLRCLVLSYQYTPMSAQGCFRRDQGVNNPKP